MNIQVRPDYASICRAAAQIIAALIRAKPDAVLGLAIGSTPIGLYDELIRLHREQGLSFARVRTFNLDEYLPISPDAPQSYARFMHEHLFGHIDIAEGNWHVPDGQARPVEEIERNCAAYEDKIRDAGGLDLQVLGIGRSGHIGFNEPGSPRDSRTRLVVLGSLTRSDAAGDFFGLENVPARAITMGVDTILGARQVLLLALGARKAGIVGEAVQGKVTSKVPASFLREHPNATFWLDEAAASQIEGRGEPGDDRAQIIRAGLERKVPISSLEGFSSEQKLAVEADLRPRMDDEARLP